MTLQPVTASAPSAWACFLINGDSDGLDMAEEQAARAFVAFLGAWPCDCQDAGFIWRPDSFRFWPYGADCQDYTTLIQSEESSHV